MDRVQSGGYNGYNSYIQHPYGVWSRKSYLGSFYNYVQNSTNNQNGRFLIGYSALIGSNGGAINEE